MATVSLDVAELDALLARIEPQVAKADHEQLTSVVATLVELTRAVRARGATIARLRRMLGQSSSEKTANVLGKGQAEAKGSADAETPSAQGEQDGEAPPAGESDHAPANDGGRENGDQPKPKRKGHGRIPASAYASETIAVAHPTLCAGQSCPKCAHGALYSMPSPVSTVRIFGQAPLVALRWDSECLRCNGCGVTFTAPLPEQARGPKHSESAASMMVVLRYDMGVPLLRLEHMQHFLGVPVPASTQWQVALAHVEEVLPVYNVLVSLAANAPLVHNDDTYARVLSLMGKRRDELVRRNALQHPERTGVFTTVIVAQAAPGPIALFATGRQHAGENLGDLLDHRDPALGDPMLMCDGLDRNLPTDHRVVLANCLAHGRRHVVDEVDNHPELCTHLLEEIGRVFAHDETCRKEGITGAARLELHQRKSGPVMAALRSWIDEVFADKRVEPNSGLGGALNYLRARWDALTLFLRVEDAPLDNNISERSLKRAIRHRKSSLFYLTTNGARVGDIYTALIATTQLHRGDPFRYLTALFTNHKAVAAAPAEWLPWNYEDALARLEQQKHTAAAA
jgi:hypothetical protein